MFLQLSRLLLLGSLLVLAFEFTAAQQQQQQQWDQTSAAAPSEEETTEEPEAHISSTSSQIGDETEEEAEQQQKVQKTLASCDVFDPFKVLPAEPGHFQIGGAFPLHGPDCLELDAASVQDVVAVQWAMAYWNEQKKATDAKEEDDNDTTKAKQSQRGRRPKLGLFAGDSCSRPKEAIAQSLRFLDSLGYHEPGECVPGKGSSSSPLMAEAERKRKSTAAAKIIALLAPRDRESAEAVAQVVRPSGVPVAVYSPAAAQAFLDASVAGFVTTAPLLPDFGRSLVALLGMLGSDLVSIVDYGDGFPLSAKLVEQLRQQGISVAELVPFDHPQLASMLAASDAQIIVSLVSNQLLAATGVGRQSAIRDMDKLWITLELEAGYEPTEEPSRLDFFAPEEKQKAKLQVLTIRRQQRYLADFNAYFLRILLTNYEHYSLLNGYVQHVYNCSQQQTTSAQKTGGGKKPKAVCSQEQLEPRRLAQLHKQSPSLEPIVLLVYALARTAQRVEQNAELLAKCATPSAACFDGIRAELLQMGTEEATSPAEGRLPPGFGDRLAKLRFFETGEGAIQAAGIGLEAVLLEKEGRDGGNIYRLLEYYTGLDENGNPVGTVEKAALPQRLRQIRSKCPRHRAYCQEKCGQATRRPDDQTFLSLPEHFSLYLSAMFDFQSGPNCDRLRRSNPASVAMPLAFVHAMSTFRQRHSPKSALFRQGPNGQMDIGSLLVDTCSSGRTLMEFLVDSERNCYKFSQVERNWTIAAGATIGYVFGSEELGPSQAGMLGAISAGPSASPVITTAIGGDAEAKAAEEAGGLFSFEPSHGAFGLALAKFLRRMHWTYVNVVLDRSDATSVSLYDHFVRQSAGTICTADLTIVGDGEAEADKEKGGRRASRQQQPQQQAGNKRTAAEQLRFGAMATPNANVTLVFGAAKTAAEWMSARLRDEFLGAGTGTTVHVMLGEAHDFYLHDPTNLAQYAGTVSFQAKDVSSADFHDWLRSITPLTLPEIWYWRHVEENWQCALARSNIQRFHGRMCSGEELLNVNGMGRLTRAGYLARGVDRLLSAIDEAHKKLCPEGEKLCEDFTANGRKLIRELLAKVDKESADQFEAYQLITSGGHQGKLEYKMFANYSSAGGQLQLLADYRPPFANAGSNEPASGANSLADDADRKPAVVSRCRGPFCRCRANAMLDLAADSPTDQDSPSLASSTYIRREPATGANSRKEDSAEELVLLYENDDPEVQQLAGLAERELTDALRIVLAVLSAMLCALAAATLLLILVKMYQRRIKGHQSLGLLLLCGICALFADAFLFASAPSDLICHLRIAVHALAHALCFGVIIVKAIQLRNAETLALMGATAQQISYWNYWLLLAFIFAVQLVICLKWLLAKPLDWLSAVDHQTSMDHFPPAAAAGDRVLLCSYSSPNFVLAQVYSFLLLFLALLLSAQNRNIKRNYKEAKWLFITSLSCTLLLCAWAACHVLVSPLYLDHMTVLELHLTGTVLLAFVFGPKLYVLLFYEPVVVECVYGGSLGPGGGRDSKAGDLFEAADWCHGDYNCTSPTLTNRSDERHRMNGGGPATEEDEEEKVTSAFQTILRKKTSAAGNGNKKCQNGATNSHCPTPRMGQRGGGKQKERLTEPQQRTRRAEHPGAAQNV